MTDKSSRRARGFGPTGRFPNGQLNPGDAGELQFGIAADNEQGIVVLNFGTAVQWLGLPPTVARELATSLLRKAGTIDGCVTTVSVDGEVVRAALPKASTLGEAWESFAEAVMPPDVPDIQIQEMRRAFYAGVWFLLGHLSDVADDFSEQDGATRIEEIHQECLDFQSRVGVDF